MAATCLSGTSGALYYKPAGTIGTFNSSDVTIGTETITVDPFLNFEVGDPVKFSVVNSQTGAAGTGTLPAGLNTSDTFFVASYTAATGALTVSATNGGSAVDITDTGTAASPNVFQIAYGAHESVSQVREWTFEITRDEIDVTTIGGTPGQFVPFRKFISGFGDGSGSATVYMTEIEQFLKAEIISREQFDNLAVAINTGTNLPSVATPNGQAAFLFLLTSSLAPLIGLSYARMVFKALPYTIVLTTVGLLAVIYLL